MQSDRRAGICTISALATIKVENGQDDVELVARTHLKTVARLLAIPDGAGQWKFTANTIFANSTQGSSAQFFGFHIMRYSRGEERRGKSVWLRFWPQRFGLGQRSGLEVWRIGGLDGWTVGGSPFNHRAWSLAWFWAEKWWCSSRRYSSLYCPRWNATTALAFSTDSFSCSLSHCGSDQRKRPSLSMLPACWRTCRCPGKDIHYNVI